MGEKENISLKTFWEVSRKIFRGTLLVTETFWESKSYMYRHCDNPFSAVVRGTTALLTAQSIKGVERDDNQSVRESA